MPFDDDLSICDKEPIHIPGSIQPDGYMCSYDQSTLKITSVSQNIPDAKSLINRSIYEIIPQAVIDNLNSNRHSVVHEDVLYDVKLPYFKDGYFDIAQLSSKKESIFEIFPRLDTLDNHDCNYKLNHSIELLSKQKTITQMCDVAAKEIKRISEFDRVMVYQFDQDKNGSVISEVKEDGIGSYLGLHFPADDIPAPARELYKKQTVRTITDVDYKSVDLIRIGDLESLDMTYSHLRSVSPIHIEYLQNMKVKATLTISVIVDGELWGLIACHNYTPKYLSIRKVSLLKTFGVFFSTLVESSVKSSYERRSIELRSTLDTIIKSMQLSRQYVEIEDLVSHHLSMFSKLFECDGFVFKLHNNSIISNNVDIHENNSSLIKLLKPLAKDGFFCTNNLSLYLPELKEKTLVDCAGVIFVKVDLDEPTYWLWYRNEKAKTVNWGGDPYNRMTINEDGRIQPRQSFESFKEIVHFRSEPWEDSEVDFLNSFSTSLKSFIEWNDSNKKVDIQQEQIKQMEDEKTLHYQQLIESLNDMIEQRDAYTAGHTFRVAKYSDMIAKEMKLDSLRRQKLYEAAVLHDIGKIVVPDAILLKPGRLSKNEFSLIKSHLDAGYDILNKIDYYKPLAEIIRYHHEKYDGTGYLGFKGDDIPVEGHILIVADAIDAMTSNRIYQARKTVEEAVSEIVSLKGRWYDPDVVDATKNVFENFSNEDEETTQMPITDLEKARLSYYFKDQLTGSYNETYLKMVIDGLAFDSSFESFIFVKVGGMTKFNSNYGWHAGDEMLILIAEQIHKQIDNNSSIVFRVLGDDFVIGMKSLEQALSLENSLNIEIDREISISIEKIDRKDILKILY
jgi:diguanylate cyclase (GGDEF)-like protein/putative nucleotidyltransferase with HDIG domain